MLLLKNI